MGFEGANVLFDTWVHPLMMGLEEHLLGMFREDNEFHADAAPSHLGPAHQPVPPPFAGEGGPRVSEGRERGAPVPERSPPLPPAPQAPSPAEGGGSSSSAQSTWAPDAEKELRKIPFFVRGKARANTERFAHERELPLITVETLYDAKAHFGR